MEVILAKIQSEDTHKCIKELSHGSSTNDLLFKEKVEKLLHESALGGGAEGSPELEELRKKKLDE